MKKINNFMIALHRRYQTLLIYMIVRLQITFIGPFVEIEECEIDSNTKINIALYVRCYNWKNCFIAHSVVFTNDLFDNELQIHRLVLRKTSVGIM